NNLAAALMNKAVALDEIGQFSEAVAVYEHAIAIVSRLFDEEGRQELVHELATALLNRARMSEQAGQVSDAAGDLGRAIALWADAIERGMTHLVPNLMNALAIRITVRVAARDMDGAVVDTLRSLNLALPILRSNPPSQEILQKLGVLVGLIRSLTP